MEQKNRLEIARSGEFSYSLVLEKDFSKLGACIAQCRSESRHTIHLFWHRFF